MMKYNLMVLICIALLLMGCLLGSGRFVRTSTPVSLSGLPTGDTTRELKVGALVRRYIVHVPAGLDFAQAVPVVLVFHGGGGNPANIMGMTGFSRLADEQGFAVVYPYGSGVAQDKLLTFNAGLCCAYAVDHAIADVAFTRALLVDLQTVITIDPKRVYATGFSNGGMMVQRLGCEMADVFAAIAPVSGTLNVDPCKPSQPISVLEFHGTADQNILYGGGPGPQSITQLPFVSVEQSIDFWRKQDGCPPHPVQTQKGSISHDLYFPCKSETSVELYTIDGGGHAWPEGKTYTGGVQPTAEIDATLVIWQFFAGHPKP